MMATEEQYQTARLKISQKQSQALTALNSNLYDVLVYGGAAGGGKTYLGCIWIISNSLMYPGSRWFMGRNVLKDLKQSTVLSVFQVLGSMGMVKDVHYRYREQAGEIIVTNPGAEDSIIHLLELKYEPSDPLFNKFGSKEYTGGFIEEGQENESIAVETLMSRIRYKTDEFGLRGSILIGCNPHKGYLYTDYYDPWKNGKLPEGRMFIPSLVTDNPFVSESYKRKLHNIKNEAIKQRLLYGNWDFEDNPDQLIPYAWLNNWTIDTLPIDPKRKSIGVDLANEGDDKSFIVEWHDNVIVNIHRINVVITDQTDISGDIGNEIIKYAQQRGIGYRDIHVDAVGVGVGARDYLRGKGWYVDSYKGGEAVESKDQYQQYTNLRTYSYWQMREGLQNQQIKIYSQCPYQEEIKRQLAAHTFSTNDKVIILEKKELVKKKIGSSPDIADAAVMGLAPQPKNKFAFAISNG